MLHDICCYEEILMPMYVGVFNVIGSFILWIAARFLFLLHLLNVGFELYFNESI